MITWVPFTNNTATQTSRYLSSGSGSKQPILIRLLHQKMLFMLCIKFCWNWPSGCGGFFFRILSMYFRYFIIISPWKRALLFIWTNLSSLHPGMLCAKSGRTWPVVLEFFFISSVMYVSCMFAISLSSLLGKTAWPFTWINLNHLHPNALCQVWSKLSQWFWRRRW